jgi:acetate kinase
VTTAGATGAKAGTIVLALNSGSSSLKFGLYRIDPSRADILLTGEAEAIGASSADARLAIDMFRYSVRNEVAAMVADLGGVELIVFTGGIGENDPKTRASVCAGLGWLGVSLEEDRNLAGQNPLNDRASRSAVRVLPSREDEQIARHAWALAIENRTLQWSGLRPRRPLPTLTAR